MGMRPILQSVPPYLTGLIQNLRSHLLEADFVARHRLRPQDFTRQRQLTFPVVMLFVLQKTVKSIQRHLHEFLNEVMGDELFEPVTSGAWTHARSKLKHTAFIELNSQVVLPALYSQERQDAQRLWHGHRLLGVDSSLLRLPNSPELLETFTPVEVSNDCGKTGTRYPEARMSVIYDVLNQVGLDARLEPSSLGEVELAIEQLRVAKPGDVLINDRGFTGYPYLAWHHHLGLDYVARCSTKSFAAAQELFRMNRAGRSMVVKLIPPNSHRTQMRSLGLPLQLTVRFVSVRLPTGELEVLATSLLDEEQYSTEEFLEVYHQRWPHETFYGRIKGRLDLENFSGKTAEAVRQDFYATVLLCNLEAALSQPSDQQLRESSAVHKHPKQVNRAISYHALKDRLLDLLYSNRPAEQVALELQRLFLASPVTVRPERKPPRRKLSLNRSYHYQRRVKKIVY